MRLFVGLDLPPAVRAEVRNFVERERGDLPPARWVKPETYHLTLVFLGETPSGQVEGLAAALAAAFKRHAPLRLQVGQGGTYPSGRPAKVAWLGLAEAVDPASASLRALRSDVALAVAGALGEEPESRPFSPHLTLARAPAPWPRADAERFAERSARAFGPPFEVGEGWLLESHLLPGGAQYRQVARFPLARRPVGVASEGGAA